MKKIITSISILTALTTSSLYAAGGGDIFRSSMLVDKLEYQNSKEKATRWDISAYAGYDLNKIYLNSEGEKPKNGNASSENQLLYAKAISPYWDFLGGVEYDKTPTANKSWAAVGVQGLAPYFFETKATLLGANDGNFGLKATAEFDTLITQKLILTPSLSISAYGKNDPKMELGSGLSNITAGARLRYEIKREFAPYVGFEWTKNYGKTNEYAPLRDAYMVFGVRFWF